MKIFTYYREYWEPNATEPILTEGSVHNLSWSAHCEYLNELNRLGHLSSGGRWHYWSSPQAGRDI